MIVADSNVIAALVVPDHLHRESSLALLQMDDDWRAPVLWRSEVCNVLTTLERNGVITADEATTALKYAELTMRDRAYDVVASEVLQTAMDNGCAAYDAEFVVLARDLGVKLVTNDGPLRKRFPKIAVSPETHVSGGAV